MCDKHVEQNEAVEKIAQEIQNQCRIKARDSLHVASAIIGEVDYCLTCDDRVARWKSNRCIKRITQKLGKPYVSVMNPIRFIQKHFPRNVRCLLWLLLRETHVFFMEGGDFILCVRICATQ